MSRDTVIGIAVYAYAKDRAGLARLTRVTCGPQIRLREAGLPEGEMRTLPQGVLCRSYSLRLNPTTAAFQPGTHLERVIFVFDRAPNLTVPIYWSITGPVTVRPSRLFFVVTRGKGAGEKTLTLFPRTGRDPLRVIAVQAKPELVACTWRREATGATSIQVAPVGGYTRRMEVGTITIEYEMQSRHSMQVPVSIPVLGKTAKKAVRIPDGG